jgi:hypothetical protein
VSGIIQFTVDGETVSTPLLSGATLSGTVTAINGISGLNTAGVFAVANPVTSKLEIYSNRFSSIKHQPSLIAYLI